MVLVGLLAAEPDPVAEHLGVGVERHQQAVDQLPGVHGGGDRLADGQLGQGRVLQVEGQVLEAERGAHLALHAGQPPGGVDQVGVGLGPDQVGLVVAQGVELGVGVGDQPELDPVQVGL